MWLLSERVSFIITFLFINQWNIINSYVISPTPSTSLTDTEIFNRELYDHLTTNNPCLVHYCSKGRECVINPKTQQPECVCQKYCSYRKRLICGTNNQLYNNHCQLHRDACIKNITITYQDIDNCLLKNKITATTTTTELISQLSDETINNFNAIDSNTNDNHHHHHHCTSQEYEIMKDNLLLYNHDKLISQQPNNNNKDFLISIMFSHYDRNNNGILELNELNEMIFLERTLIELSNGCLLVDLIKYDDMNMDGKLNINEFYQAFSKLYSVSVISLDKALEINHLSVRVGDNVEIKCDVTGSPLPPLIWQRNNIELSAAMDNIKIFSSESLYLTKIQLYHSGNYSCHAQRNKDVVQTHVVSVYTVPEVHVMPKIQSKRPDEMAEIQCHVAGEPFPQVEWLKNDVIIRSNENEKYQILGNGTILRILNIKYSDTGAYMCQGSNVGGRIRDISTLLVQDEPTPTIQADDRKFFVFHQYGIAIYEPSACHLNHQIRSTDIIPGTQELVCPSKTPKTTTTETVNKCSWGRAINVHSNYIYVSQPYHSRILVISIIQMVIIDIIVIENKFPVNLYYIKEFDQIWLMCWQLDMQNNNSMQINGNAIEKNVQIIANVKKRHKYNIIIPNFSIKIKDFYVPEHFIHFKYGYLTELNKCKLYKIDLRYFKIVKSIDLSDQHCQPENLEFSSLYGYVMISCFDSVTKNPSGQLILDYLTDSIIRINEKFNGYYSQISPDSRNLVTLQYNNDGVLIIIQRITANGLEFQFDVKTTMNLSAITFYESQSWHGYDFYATIINKENLLYINLQSGKVEMITGVGISTDFIEWNNPNRLIQSSGLFGKYLITPSANALYIINGKIRTINCEIGGILHATAVIWTLKSSTLHSNYKSYSDDSIKEVEKLSATESIF